MVDPVTDNAIRHLPETTFVTNFWQPTIEGTMILNTTTAAELVKGTPCRLRPSGRMWEVVGGAWDGIRFEAHP